jgi:hypothetical protein
MISTENLRLETCGFDSYEIDYHARMPATQSTSMLFNLKD